MAERSDEQLVSDYLDGDAVAFDFLVARYVPVLYRFLFRFVSTSADAQDATQETLVKIWKNIRRYDLKRPFKTWVFTVAKNTAIDLAKKKRPTALADFEDDDRSLADTIEDETPLPDRVVENVLLAERLDAAIAGLPPKSKVAFLLHYDEGLTFREIAEITGEALDTVKSRAFRAAKQLRARLANHEDMHQKPV